MESLNHTTVKKHFFPKGGTVYTSLTVLYNFIKGFFNQKKLMTEKIKDCLLFQGQKKLNE
jgi:hypothetical protein